jgi:aminopeptidase N
VQTLTWLEEVFGSYPYPQMTMLKRLDGGGTEFPMMMQNGSNSASLVTHEGAHIYAHGILANNEWQSGWLDEGFASYVTAWQTGNVRVSTAEALAGLDEVDPANSADLTLATQRRDRDILARARAVQFANGELDAMGTRGDAFRSFAHYNAAVYRRAEEMYAALHDLIGDAAFRAFVRDYFARWAFRHVDRWAMQGSAERVTGESLGWFFDQWVDRTGVIQYAIANARLVQTATGWRTTVRLNRTGAYRHAMPVGVRTAAGWTVVRADPLADSEDVVIETSGRPIEVVLDPFGATEAVAITGGRITLAPNAPRGSR